jgi:hypothetical protein
MPEPIITKKKLDKPFRREYKETELYEKNILDSLILMGIIGKEFTGSVIIHLSQGGICDYEKNEKGLRKRINLKG